MRVVSSTGGGDGLRGDLPRPGGRSRRPLGHVGQGAQGAQPSLARRLLRTQPHRILRRPRLPVSMGINVPTTRSSFVMNDIPIIGYRELKVHV